MENFIFKLHIDTRETIARVNRDIAMHKGTRNRSVKQTRSGKGKKRSVR